jgi:hypothetical protein
MRKRNLSLVIIFPSRPEVYRAVCGYFVQNTVYEDREVEVA